MGGFFLGGGALSIFCLKTNSTHQERNHKKLNKLYQVYKVNNKNEQYRETQ